MPFYAIITFDIIDPPKYQEYISKVMPLLAKWGGECIVADFEAEFLESNPKNANIILKFPDRDALFNWYNDPEYQPVKKLRYESTQNTYAVVVRHLVLPGN